MFYPRKILLKLKKELRTREIILLTGMRQVGKTTLLDHLFKSLKSKNKVFLDLENPLHQKVFAEENYDNIWRNLEEFGVSPKSAFIFLDEIQNFPEISRIVKYFYDHWQTKFFLTGSSSFYLKNLFPESLAGRKLVFELFPLTFEEFLWFKGIDKKAAKGFVQKIAAKNKIAYERHVHYYREFMEFGGMPKIVLEKDRRRKKQLLEEVFKSYFEKDVRSLADFKEVGKLRDLIFLLASRIGSKVDITKLASELSLSRETVYHYLSFLEKTYFVSLLSRFSRSADRTVSGQRKLYFSDTGLANILAKVSDGQLFENSVFQNLQPDFRLNFYSKEGQSEIDFIADGKFALEAKISFGRSEISRLKKLSQNLNLKGYGISLNFSQEKQIILAIDL